MKRDNTPLPAEALKMFLTEHPGWAVKDGQLERLIEFPAFLTGIAFVQKIAVVAEAANHHPDLDIRWRKVTVRLFTHDAKALTGKDVELAAAADKLVTELSAAR